MVGGTRCFCSLFSTWLLNGIVVIIPLKPVAVQMQTWLLFHTRPRPNLDNLRKGINCGQYDNIYITMCCCYYSNKSRCQLRISFVHVPALCGTSHEWAVSISGSKEKQQPELLPVWKPRLRCSVSSAIVLVIVNLGHLPGGISHSSNKFHKTNHKVLHCWLPLIEF